MAEGADAKAVQPLFKSLHFGGGGVHGHAHAAHEQAPLLKRVDEAQHVEVVGDAVIAAHLVADDVLGADDDDDLSLILELQQHLQLGVRLEAGQHAGGVVVIEQLAAEFQIQLVVELRDPLPDVLRLHLKVFVVVKSFFHSLLLFFVTNPAAAVTPWAAPEVSTHRVSIPYQAEQRNEKSVPKTENQPAPCGIGSIRLDAARWGDGAVNALLPAFQDPL